MRCDADVVRDSEEPSKLEGSFLQALDQARCPQWALRIRLWALTDRQLAAVQTAAFVRTGLPLGVAEWPSVVENSRLDRSLHSVWSRRHSGHSGFWKRCLKAVFRARWHVGFPKVCFMQLAMAGELCWSGGRSILVRLRRDKMYLQKIALFTTVFNPGGSGLILGTWSRLRPHPPGISRRRDRESSHHEKTF